MIFKITWEDGRMDICTAKDELDLLKSYDKDYDLYLQEIESIEVISDEEAKTTIINVDGVGMPLLEEIFSDEFKIVASTDF